MFERVQMVEIGQVPDVYVDDIGDIENLKGGNFRRTYYVLQGGIAVMAARIIMPRSVHLRRVGVTVDWLRAYPAEGMILGDALH
jgi:hypothetical protein